MMPLPKLTKHLKMVHDGLRREGTQPVFVVCHFRVERHVRRALAAIGWGKDVEVFPHRECPFEKVWLLGRHAFAQGVWREAWREAIGEAR